MPISQIVHAGEDSLEHLPILLNEIGARRVMLVTGHSLLNFTDMGEKVTRLLANFTIERFNDFMVNPQLPDVAAGILHFRGCQPEALLAVGGGSVIDMAKLIRALAPATAPLPAFVRGEFPLPPSPYCPMIAVPTTAGSGSEATPFAVVYHEATKYSLEDESIQPDIVLLDPRLTWRMPAALTATTGMDALCHCVESYWSIHATPASQAIAREALGLIQGNLEIAVNAPTPCAREAMLWAAHLAGRAITVTKTSAAHALSYPMTALYGIPHGQAVALSLNHFIRYNQDVNVNDVADSRGLAYVRGMLAELYSLFGQNDAEATVAEVTRLMASINMPAQLSVPVGMVEDARQRLCIGANIARLRNNPRAVTPEAIKSILATVVTEV